MAKKIMVVDDSLLICAQMEAMLENTEFEVAAYCQDGEEALAQYRKVKPDLVTMDIIMGGMDGLEATEALLEAHPEAKVVMVSSLACGETLDGAAAMGAKGFVEKPFEQEQLLAAFRKALETP